MKLLETSAAARPRDVIGECLFATETFSIGLNMPAKTVVFTNVRKWDGDKFRWLTGGEYIQMSGRAGRRGLDDRGVCILMVDAKMEPAVAKGMVRGSADALDSAFHLTYSMVLNQMRSEDSDIERMMALSFAQFQAGRALPSLNKKVRQLEEERDGVVIEEQEHVEEYLSLQQQLRKLRQGVRAIVAAPQHALPFLSPGRIVRVLCRPYSEEDEEEEEEAGEGGRGQNGAAAGGGAAASGGGEAVAWGVVINFQKVATPKDLADEDEPERTEARYNVDVLAECREEESTSGRGRGHHVRPCGPHEHGEPTVVALPLSQVDRLSAVRVYIAKDLRPPEAREAALKALRQVQLRFPDGVPMLDPEDDMQVDSSSYRKGVRRIEAIEGLLASHPLAQSATLRTRLAALRHKERLTAAIKAAKREVKGASGLILKDELKARKRVLRRLGYITSDDVVEVKGRVACEISTGDELTLTELIFAGVFKDLSVPQLAALVSCFVWQEKTGSQTGSTKLREALSAPLSQLRDVARRVGKVQLECKMSIDVEEYVANFRPNIMEAVFAWCQGAKFSELLKMADVFEGSLIRALRRLEELMRQLATACKTIGETELEGRFQEAIEKMKRDIVFAASLYL